MGLEPTPKIKMTTSPAMNLATKMLKRYKLDSLCGNYLNLFVKQCL
jgi:hypothetical protein